jgi:hypothetical protein
VLITETNSDAFVVPLPKQSRNGAAIFKTIRGLGGSFELPFSPGSWSRD